jgi:hypothetical protein
MDWTGLCEQPQELRTINAGRITQRGITYNAIIRTEMYCARRSVLPVRPTNVQQMYEVLINLNYKTSHEEYFRLVNDQDTNILMFSCARNLEVLLSLTTIVFIDSTFPAPNFFTNYLQSMTSKMTITYLSRIFYWKIKNIFVYQCISKHDQRVCNAEWNIFLPKYRLRRFWDSYPPSSGSSVASSCS